MTDETQAVRAGYAAVVPFIRRVVADTESMEPRIAMCYYSGAMACITGALVDKVGYASTQATLRAILSGMIEAAAQCPEMRDGIDTQGG